MPTGIERHVADPRLGVVVVTRNRLGSLRRTLDRLDALPEEPQILVVDNASSDGTAAAVAREHPGAILFVLDRNRGATARTLGARALDRPYIAFADDDSWWAPGALSHACGVLDAYPQVGLVAARVLVGEEERDDPTCTAMANSPLAGDDLPGRPVLGFIACGAVARREALLAAGGFHRRWEIQGEEGLLAVDLAREGWVCVYVPEVVAHHHPSVARDSSRRDVLEVRNSLWFAWLRRPRRAVASITLRAAARSLTDGSARRGLLEAVRGVGWVLRERRVVPAELERQMRAVGL
jgi:GT2 family glycosyltransferase